jgi:hypothetical protein
MAEQKQRKAPPPPPPETDPGMEFREWAWPPPLPLWFKRLVGINGEATSLRRPRRRGDPPRQ